MLAKQSPDASSAFWGGLHILSHSWRLRRRLGLLDHEEASIHRTFFSRTCIPKRTRNDAVGETVGCSKKWCSRRLPGMSPQACGVLRIRATREIQGRLKKNPTGRVGGVIPIPTFPPSGSGQNRSLSKRTRGPIRGPFEFPGWRGQSDLREKLTYHRCLTSSGLTRLLAFRCCSREKFGLVRVVPVGRSASAIQPCFPYPKNGFGETLFVDFSRERFLQRKPREGTCRDFPRNRWVENTGRARPGSPGRKEKRAPERREGGTSPGFPQKGSRSEEGKRDRRKNGSCSDKIPCRFHARSCLGRVGIL